MKLSQRFNQLYNSEKLPWIIICVGIILRLRRYLFNPSPSYDPIGNALIIVTQSFSDFLGIAPYGQSMPLGFGVLEKLATLLFGNSEFALRLLPLLSGIVSLFLFYYVAKNIIKPKAVPIALGLFAISEILIDFSSHIKQYSTDIAITLLLYAVIVYFQSKKLTSLRIVYWSAIGAIVLWISHPAALVMAGIGITLAISSLLNKEWAEIKKMLFVFSIWFMSFLAVYFVYNHKMMESFKLTNNDIYWTNKIKAFMPLPPMSLQDIQWYLDVLFKTMENPAGFTLTGIAVLAFLVGCISIFLRRKKTFFILTSPIFITLLVSGFHIYPFAERTLSFLVPILFLFIAEGAEDIRERTNRNIPVVGIIIIVLLFIHPLSMSAYHFMKPPAPEQSKSALRYVKQNWQEGDLLYVYYYAYYAFEYYSKHHPDKLEFDEDEYIIGKAHKDWYANYDKTKFTGFWDKDKPFSQPFYSILKEHADELNELRGRKRVWFLFAGFNPTGGIYEENFYVYHLETIGKRLDYFGKKRVSSVYLYDLSGETSAGLELKPDNPDIFKTLSP